MKRFLPTKHLFLLCLLSLVAQMGWSGTHNGNAVTYTPNSNNWLSSIVKNSSGDDVRILGDGNYEKQIAITGSFNTDPVWTFRNQNGAEIYVSGQHSQTLSVMNLFSGDKVRINYWGTKKPTVKSTNTNVAKGNEVNSTTDITMNSTGSMDFTIPAGGMFITSIVVTYANTSNRMAFDTSGATDGFFRCRLSSRTFDEPALSVYPSNANVTYTVETYDKMNGTKLNDASHEVAMLNNQDNKLGDLLFKNLGWCKVTATANGMTASYWVEAWDNEAIGELQADGITYKLVKVKDEDGNLLPNNQQGGVLKERVVTAVGGIEMKFGIPAHDEYDYVHDLNGLPGGDNGTYAQQHDNSDNHYQPNTTVVYRYVDGNNTEHMVSFTNDDNGWWDRYPHNNFTWPYQGTFYSFKATAKGKLKFGGYKSQQSGKVYIVNLSTKAQTPIVDRGATVGFYVSQEIEMDPGQIYVLHGEAAIENNNEYWAPFLLEWFSYETDIKLSATWGVSAHTGYEIGNGGSVTSRETITNASNATCTVACKGNIQSASASIDGSGHIVFSNIQFKSTEKDKMGGAMKVTIKVGTSYRTFYMTIPYGQHIWDFRRAADQATEHGDFSYDETGLINMMKNNTDDWTRVYKVHRNDGQGNWTELISPIMAARSAIEGNNAFYMDNTVGLAFTTDNIAGFGAGETSNNATGFADMTKTQQYYLNYETTSGGSLVWIQGSATIYFPGVKAGQYIKVHTYRHSDNKGENFKANNVKDLDGKTYNPNDMFKLRGMWEARYCGYVGDYMRGGAIFRVTADATNDITQIPSLTLSDDGWAQVYRIEISDEYKPDLFMTTDAGNGEVYVDEDGINGSIVVRNGQAVEKSYLAITGNTGSQNANSCDYDVIYNENDVNVEVNRKIWSSPNHPEVKYNQLVLNFKGGSGLVKLIQRERANSEGTNVSTAGPSDSRGYVIDKREYNIAVGELTKQTYPYTWDFNGYNMYQGTSTTQADLTAAANANAGMWSNNDDTFSQVTTTTYKMGDNTTSNPEQEYTVTKPLFAQGAQLVAGNKTIIETKGLGIQLPYTTQDKDFIYVTSTGAPTGQVIIGHRPYKAYDMTKKFAIDGNTLTGCGQITIPSVDNGMYVFVKASAAPSVTIGGNAVQAISDYEPASGVYVYKNTGATADVVLAFASEVSIDKIGVTNIDKKINKLGYATESRNHAIDHTYTGIFTSNDVNAYGIYAYGDNGSPYVYEGYTEVHKTNEVTVVPENTGIVLFKDDNNAEFHAPLFYPACNVTPTEDDLTTLATNCMAPNVESTRHYSETIQNKAGVCCTKFIMTTKYYTYKKKTGESTDEQTSAVEAFYRMRIDTNEATAAQNNTIGDNKAYLLVPNDYMPTALWNGGDGQGNPGSINTYFIDLSNSQGEDIDGIESALLSQPTDEMSQKVYYTIDGTRLNGRPTSKGIYICNGKKVIVK